MEKTKIKIYQCGYGKVTLVESNGLVMVNATQMSRPYGVKKIPSRWLDNKSTDEIIIKAAKSKKHSKKELVIREGRCATWLHESLAVEYAKWLSPETMDFAYWIMRIIEDFSTLAQREEEQKPQKTTTVRRKKSDSDTEPTYTVSQIAEEFGMSAIELNSWLQVKGIQCKRGNQWHLSSKFRNKGYTKTVSLCKKCEDGNIYTFSHTQWTEKGRDFLHNMMKLYGTDKIEEQKPAEEAKKSEEVTEQGESRAMNEVNKELEMLREEIAKLKAENEELKKENSFLKKDNDKVNADNIIWKNKLFHEQWKADFYQKQAEYYLSILNQSFEGSSNIVYPCDMINKNTRLAV